MTKSFSVTLVWLLGSFIATLMSLNVLPASLVDGQYTPVGNDSFYHARRILDTSADPTAFYEFDRRIHVPEGSLITWPWAYDYYMAKAVSIVMATGLQGDPMKILVYIPVFALFISIGLIVAISRTLELSLWGTALATLCAALSPLTQTLHGVGVIDHHFAEYIFTLAALCASIMWMKNPNSQRYAALIGLILGVAPAFQNGLFFLQLPVLIAIAILWLRNKQPPFKSAATFGIALLASCLLALLPSQPFQEGRFEFYLLSWFHLYIAVCTAIIIVLMARFQRSLRSIAGVLIFAILALIPILGQILMGSGFIAGNLDVLPLVSEARSPARMLELSGIDGIFKFYSALIIVVPLSLVASLWFLAKRDPSPPLTAFLVFCAGGLLLLAMQFRLHVFGSFALFLPIIMAAEMFAQHRRHNRKLIMSLLSAALVLAYTPVSKQLFAKHITANDASYEPMRHMYPSMREACGKRPGVVLANSNSGHFIRFYTECSVIANNFLLTQQHAAKFYEVEKLMTLTPQQLLDSGVVLNYVYVSILDMAPKDPLSEQLTFGTLEDLKQVNYPLVAHLLFSEPEVLGPRYKLVHELRFPGENGAPYARFYAILPKLTTARVTNFVSQ